MTPVLTLLTTVVEVDDVGATGTPVEAVVTTGLWVDGRLELADAAVAPVSADGGEPEALVPVADLADVGNVLGASGDREITGPGVAPVTRRGVVPRAVTAPPPWNPATARPPVTSTTAAPTTTAIREARCAKRRDSLLSDL
jgi:hypothetical protein